MNRKVVLRSKKQFVEKSRKTYFMYMSDRNAITISFAVVRRELSLEDDDESTSLKLEMSLPIFMLN